MNQFHYLGADMSVIKANSVTTLEQGVTHPIESGTMFTFQSVGSGSAIVSVSNDSKNWVQLAEFTDLDSAIVQHSWKFMKIAGSNSVLVSVR